MPSTPVPWRALQRQNFQRWEPLADFLELSATQRLEIDATPDFPLNLPRRLADKIAKATIDDPILRQFLPLVAERIAVPGFTSDPLDEKRFRQSPKLLHKYEGRALLICTSACAMHCRYCFRRHFDYDHSGVQFHEELQQIRDDPSIQELLLSGGDPLSLDDTVLNALITACDAIPHLQRLRIHTRFPVGIPERIDDSLLKILSNRRLKIWFVIHCNHALELDPDVSAALTRLQKLGIPILCQTVLLRGVNDSLQPLKELCEALVNNGVTPYYLHQLDRISGAAHFEVPLTDGLALITRLRALLPGYAIPRYVQERPGEPSKTLLA